ncbi:MAG: hypothetical protein FWG09_03095, partial [Synergistaceae bacterium]|nr:hypothetical protein [Synergistaceae bacterium]
MKSNLRIFCFIALLSIIFCACAEAAQKAAETSQAAQSELELSFTSRKWGEIDSIVKRGNLSARDRSLAANAYRLQNRWADAAE